jgi:hypothetical protein
MAYLYNLGYTSYEDSSFLQFEHDEDLTKEQLLHCLAKALARQYYHHEADCIKAGGWVRKQMLGRCWGSPVFMACMEEQGFRRVKYHREATVWGWNTIPCQGEEGDKWLSEWQEDDETLHQAIREELYNLER